MKKKESIVDFMMKYDCYRYNYFCNLRFTKTVKACEQFLLSNAKSISVKNKINSIYFPNNLAVFSRQMQYKNDANLKDILEWDMLILEFGYKKINKYLQLKCQYERELFAYNYEKAWMSLCEIEAECGFSMWLLEQQLNVLYGLKMEKEADELLNSYQKSTGKNKLLNNIFKFIKWRKNPEVKFSEYVQYVDNSLASRDEKRLDTKYLKNKIVLEKEKTKETFQFILQIDETFSAIDLYETVIEALFFVLYQDDSEVDIKKVRAFCNIFDDKRLRNMLIYRGEDFGVSNIDEYQDVADILETYSMCDWCAAEKSLKEYLLKNPNDFMMQHLFVKCRLFQDLEIENDNPIQHSLYKLYTMNENIIMLQNDFQEYWKKYYGTTWQYKIESIIKRKIICNEDEFDQYISVCHDSEITPMFVKILNPSDRERFLDVFKEIAPITYKSVLRQYGLNNEQISNINKIKEYYLNICYLYEKRDFGQLVKLGREALFYLESGEESLFYQHHRAYYYYKGRICRYLFNALLQNQDVKEALNLFGQVYLQKELLVRRFDVAGLIDVIESIQEAEEDMAFMGSIYAPIVYYYHFGKQRPEKNIMAYRNYLYFNGYKSLDEWMKNRPIINDAEKYFLANFCTTNLIERDYQSLSVYKTPTEFRVSILRFLLEKDSSCNKRYIEELNEIYSTQQLETQVQLINKDKIHVDINKLYDNLEAFLKSEFDNYALQQKLREELVEEENAEIGSLEDIEHIINNYDGKYRSEKTFLQFIIQKIVDEYLFNQSYGLNAYLGTRIRHNYLSQNLFAIFEKWNLLSKKEKNSSVEYMINTFWKGRVESAKEEAVLRCLGGFSKRINQKSEEIKNQWLQIRTTEKEGMFEYSGIVEYIMDYTLIYKNSYESAFHTVIDNLNKKTEKNLEEIRKRIDSELKSFFEEELVKLKEEIVGIGLSRETNSLISLNISRSLEEVPDAIRNFKDIFYYEDVKYPDFSIENAIECSSKIFKQLYPAIEGDFFHYNIETNEKFTGRLFPYWIDIISILFQNAKEYSGYSNFKDAKFLISTRYSEMSGKSWFVLEVENSLNNQSEYDKECLEIKMDTIMKNIENNEILENSMQERGSGFYKIARIVKYNLEVESFYQYVTSIDKFVYQIGLVI